MKEEIIYVYTLHTKNLWNNLSTIEKIVKRRKSSSLKDLHQRGAFNWRNGT